MTAMALLLLTKQVTAYYSQIPIIRFSETIAVKRKRVNPHSEGQVLLSTSSNKCEGTLRFLTGPTVLQGHQGYKVLAVGAKNDGISGAFLGRPVERQVNSAHLQRSEIGTRFQTSQHFVC